jgi:hypothetical protein
LSPLPISPIDINNLRPFSNERDILRDLCVYLDYVSERRIQRMTRRNIIPLADQQRIAKLLGGLAASYPGAKEIGASRWIGFIDRLALRMNLVSYDTQGEYRGYNSSEPSFINNFITVFKTQLDKFLDLIPVEQHKMILGALKSSRSFTKYQDEEPSEFFQTGILGELDPFSTYGSATGVILTLNFPEIRQFLLDLLSQCAPGIWYSTQSLVQYLKTNHPTFLIPENIQPDRWNKISGRYDNFHETAKQYSFEAATVPVTAPDAFERVEGRYVERFLENIPLLMRFVEVAYDPAPYKGLFPTQGILKAFRVNEQLPRLTSAGESLPRVTVQPNFDVIVEADFYPVKIVRQIAALGEQVSNPSTTSAYVGIFQLKKTRVAAEQVRQPSLDVVALLGELSRRDLPPNVQTELEEWSGHADQFTLFEGFTVLESVDEHPILENFTLERISPNFRLVGSQKALFQNLETEGCVPLWVNYSPDGTSLLAENAISLFPGEVVEAPNDKITQIKVTRSISVTIKFPDKGCFDVFRKMLAELRCPFQSDLKMQTITFDQNNQAKFDQVLQELADVYAVQIE